jgi:hypothetical protein
MPVEFKLGTDGLPYVVEFANVSVWPRRPEPHPIQDAAKPPARSKTLPSVRAQNPLPTVPDTPTRGGSLRRALRRFSEPARKLSVHAYADMLDISGESVEAMGNIAKAAETTGSATENAGSVRRRSATCSRAERDARTRAALQALAVFSMSADTLVDPDLDDGADEPEPPHSWLHVPQPARVHNPTPTDKESDDLNVRSGGLHVAFRSEHPFALPRKGEDTPKRRLRRVARAIADAVAAAGMIGPPKRAERASATSAQSEGNSLFRGTYGQVRTAMHEAGLYVKKCEEQGFDGGSWSLCLLPRPRTLTAYRSSEPRWYTLRREPRPG